MTYAPGRLLLVLALLFWPGRAAAHGDPFPTPPVLAKNVAFWQRIFTAHPSTVGIFHDSDDVDRVYGTIQLPADEDQRTADRRIRAERRAWRDALRRLGAGGAPQDAGDRRLLDLFHHDRRAMARAAHRVRFQRFLRDRFSEGLVRAGALEGEMRRILRQEGVPEDLVYLAHVESGFDPFAASKSGAVGIWQFTRSTGRRFLTIDQVVDQRRDPRAATRAAARYLKENFALLGSWPLAVTAYNYGEKGMLRAREQCGDDLETILGCYDARRFGFASRNFYAEFLAARNVARRADTFFPDLRPAPPQEFHTLCLGGYTPLADLVQFYRLEPEVIRRCNPALQPAVFRGHRYLPPGFTLQVPAGETPPPPVPAALYRPAQRRDRFHRVRRGETASTIARRYRVSLTALATANDLADTDLIRAGQTLVIPSPRPAVLTAQAKRPPTRR